MGKKGRAALLAAVCLLLTACGRGPGPEGKTETAPGTCRCLVIGADRFVTERSMAPCSANNAETMAALLSACLPEDTRITRTVDGPGSAEELENLLAEAFGEAQEGDTSFLYLSTHGLMLEGEDGSTAVLLLSDGTREETLEADRLRKMTDGIPGKKVLILDCCHAGAILEAFRGPEWRVLAGCGAEEDCFFRSAGEDTGMGYFTGALENALRASDPSQIDPDGDGNVTLGELGKRVREIYGVSGAVFYPEGDESPLFRLPAEPLPERLLGITFENRGETDGQASLGLRFRTETPVKVEYRLVPAGENGWDFEGAAVLPDRERTGLVRGLMSPGEKERILRVSREKTGGTGRALLEVVSMRGIHRQVPVVEGTAVIGGE